MTATTHSLESRSVEHAAALAQLVRQCVDTRRPLIDYGRHHAGLGHPPPEYGLTPILADTTLELYEQDLTVRVTAAVTLEALQQRLAASHQWLPLDAPGEMTLGEIVAHNVYGPLRAGFGAARDMLLGLKYIDGLGRDIHVGGRTVKNVAGYDVTRFMVGSLGEFGLLHELTLRTHALPVCMRRAQVNFTGADVAKDAHVDLHAVDALVPDLLVSEAAPSGMHMSLAEDGWTLTLTWCGTQMACDAQQSALEQLLKAHPACALASVSDALPEHGMSIAHHPQWLSQQPHVLKCIVEPARLGATAQAMVAAMKGAACHWHALPAHGVCYLGSEADPAEAIKVFDGMTGGQGVRAWYRRPAGADGPIVVPEPSDWPLLRNLKHAMDPHQLLNPGRLIGGPA